MGELFRQIRPATSIEWTGERMVPGQTGAIEAEHFHRYFLARELCRGKDVLDVASGEGYGASFLAQTARSVVGVELDSTSVEHANQEYGAPNLRYIAGEATKLPVEDRSVDVAVSFETVEHVLDQQLFLHELKRVLRPNGLLIISTPDMNIYSAPGTTSNPFHVRELTETEFREILSAAFRNVAIVRQRALSGSAILPDTIADGTTSVFERRDTQTFEADRKLLRAPYLVAVASDQNLPAIGVSLYIQGNCAEAATEVMAELQRLQAELEGARTELERLRQVEAAAREQSAAVAQMVSDAASARAEAADTKRVSEALQLHVERLQTDLDLARKEISGLREDLEDAQERCSGIEAQMEASASISRQQSLTVQRTLLELQSARREIEDYKREIEVYNRDVEDHKQELENYKSAYSQAANLLIPLRIRRLIPEPLKSPLRVLKRTLHSTFRRKH
jgi:ubiquinone/menaquinone biosynthesis C-methylase UbiE